MRIWFPCVAVLVVNGGEPHIFEKLYSHCADECVVVAFRFVCQDDSGRCHVQPSRFSKYKPDVTPEEATYSPDTSALAPDMPLSDTHLALPDLLQPIPVIGPLLSGVLTPMEQSHPLWDTLLKMLDPKDMKQFNSEPLFRLLEAYEETHRPDPPSVPAYIPLVTSQADEVPWLSQIRLPANVRAALSGLDLLQAVESKAGEVLISSLRTPVALSAVATAPQDQLRAIYEAYHGQGSGTFMDQFSGDEVAGQSMSRSPVQEIVSGFSYTTPRDSNNPMLVSHLYQQAVSPLIAPLAPLVAPLAPLVAPLTQAPQVAPQAAPLGQQIIPPAVPPLSQSTQRRMGDFSTSNPTSTDMLPWVPLDAIAGEFPEWMGESLLGPYSLLFTDLVRVAQDSFIRMQVIIDVIGDEPVPVAQTNAQTFVEKMAEAFRTSLSGNEADALKSMAVTIQQLPTVGESFMPQVKAPEGSPLAGVLNQFDDLMNQINPMRPRQLMLQPEEIKMLAANPTTSDMLPWMPLDAIIGQYPKYLKGKKDDMFSSIADAFKEGAAQIAAAFNPFKDDDEDRRDSNSGGVPSNIRWESADSDKDNVLSQWADLFKNMLATGTVEDVKTIESQQKEPLFLGKLFHTVDQPAEVKETDDASQAVESGAQESRPLQPSRQPSEPFEEPQIKPERSASPCGCTGESCNNCKVTIELPCDKLPYVQDLLTQSQQNAPESVGTPLHFKAPGFDLVQLMPAAYLPLVDEWLDDSRKILATHAAELELPPFLDPWIDESDPALSLIDLVSQISVARQHMLEDVPFSLESLPSLGLPSLGKLPSLGPLPSLPVLESSPASSVAPLQLPPSNLGTLVAQVLTPAATAPEDVLSTLIAALLRLPTPPTLNLPTELNPALFQSRVADYAHQVDSYWEDLRNVLTPPDIIPDTEGLVQQMPLPPSGSQSVVMPQSVLPLQSAEPPQPLVLSQSDALTQQSAPSSQSRLPPQASVPPLIEEQPNSVEQMLPVKNDPIATPHQKPQVDVLEAMAGIEDIPNEPFESNTLSDEEIYNTLKSIVLGGLEHLNQLGSDEYAKVAAITREADRARWERRYSGNQQEIASGGNVS
eukprot:Blabericola_migrator_1__2492@NODE_16_length_23467_cov_90_205256_g13_i0_p2_GENE_NODE_16_length_23467_cov_90_205256_g13_i0NODE_16_length_23467_cov_90_205256_g13_i0_p2_ORF_typecomplete_len1095_score178_98_NODE_16_length_23467_cov_90_205256_g13_i020525336